MQNDNRKIPTNQILSFESRAALQLFVEQKNAKIAQRIRDAKCPCLIPGRHLTICEHPGCFQAYAHPKYHITRESFLAERQDFTHFKRAESNVSPGDFYVVAVNPFHNTDPEWHRFEFTREANSMTASGEWPEGRDLFHRSEVEIVFEEYDTWRINEPLYLDLEKSRQGTTYVENYIDFKDVREVAKFKQRLIN